MSYSSIYQLFQPFHHLICYNNLYIHIKGSEFDLPKAQNLSLATVVQPAKFLSPTRIECVLPEFVFDRKYIPNFSITGYQCGYVKATKLSSNITTYTFTSVITANTVTDTSTFGVLSYVTSSTCGGNLCVYYPQLELPCSINPNSPCADNPESGYFMNPCMSAEVLIEVTNDGEHYSGTYGVIVQYLLAECRTVIMFVRCKFAK